VDTEQFLGQSEGCATFLAALFGVWIALGTQVRVQVFLAQMEPAHPLQRNGRAPGHDLTSRRWRKSLERLPLAGEVYRRTSRRIAPSCHTCVSAPFRMATNLQARPLRPA